MEANDDDQRLPFSDAEFRVLGLHLGMVAKGVGFLATSVDDLRR